MNFLYIILFFVCTSNALSHDIQKSPSVYAGGVAGVKSLTVSMNSDKFRSIGGNLYIHNTAWRRLTHGERNKVLNIFKHAKIGLELGFGQTKKQADEWGKLYRQFYSYYDIQPTFIAVNAFVKRHIPSLKTWEYHTEILRKNGVAKSTKILPTFEYQNVYTNSWKLEKNFVSDSKFFQDLIRYSKGLVIDSPPGYFFTREKSYREWIVDAIHWTKVRGYTVIVILSPHKSKIFFDEDSKQFINYLYNKNAMPDIFISENYKGKASKSYVNLVGNEDIDHTALGVGFLMLHNWLPQLDQ